jgi:F0F1-type ATP synthase assembly protein I
MADGAPQDGPNDGLRGRDLLGLGGLLAGSVIVCTAIGYLLDQAAESMPAFTLVGIALGMVAGATGFWLKVRSALRSTSRDPGSS